MKSLRLFAVLAATAALALAPAAANAESKVHVDPAGDVASLDVTSNTDTPQPAPERVEGDIHSIRVSYFARSVRVSLSYGDLARTGAGKVVSLRVRSNVNVREVDVFATKGAWAGKHTFAKANGSKAACAGLSHKIDYVANTVLVVIPRGCLSNPRWVRVAGYAASIDDGGIMYIDDARSSGYYGNTYIYGPRVHRG